MGHIFIQIFYFADETTQEKELEFSSLLDDILSGYSVPSDDPNAPSFKDCY